MVLCWIDHVLSSKEGVCCACDPNERLGAPYNILYVLFMFVFLYVGSYLLV